MAPWLARVPRPAAAQSSRRRRAIALSLPRVALVAGLVVALACTAAVVLAQRRAASEANERAHVAVALLDAELGLVALELDTWAERLQVLAVGGCTPWLRAELTRASLSSDPIRRLGMVWAGSDLVCLPEGVQRGAARPPLALESVFEVVDEDLGQTSLRLWHADERGFEGRGWLLLAQLDARSLGPALSPGNDGWALLARDQRGRVLTAGLGTQAASWRLHPPVASERFGVDVHSAPDPDMLARRTWLQAGGVALPALLLLGVGVAWAWRRAVTRARLSYRLRQALRKRQFVPYVQPIVDLRSGRCVGAEVLMRWQHPHRGKLGPAEFIEEAEYTGMIGPMSELVMGRAAHRLATLARARPELYFSFNIAPRQLHQPDFEARLRQVFRDDTLPPSRVLLEVTEREFVDAEGSRALAALHARGWRVAVDDFGTGHSSLATLEKLAIDKIKIDRAFVGGIDERTVSRPVLDAIVGLAAQLGVPLIAEGVETRSQWDYLAARGVHHAQGFLMAKPMPIEAFQTWLEARGSGTAGQGGGASSDSAASRPRANNLAGLDGPTHMLLNQMRMPGGLDVRDRMFHLRLFPRCFVGREAVDWVARQAGVAREQAVAIGRRLLALDLIRHVADEHDFEDAELFYRFVDVRAPGQADPPDAGQLARRMAGADGPQPRDHERGLVRHRHCLSGREIVDWIVCRHVVTRVIASQWAAQLMRDGALRHVYDDRPFSDDDALFRLS